MQLLSKSTMKISLRAVACPFSSLADGINSLLCPNATALFDHWHCQVNWFPGGSEVLLIDMPAKSLIFVLARIDFASKKSEFRLT